MNIYQSSKFFATYDVIGVNIINSRTLLFFEILDTTLISVAKYQMHKKVKNSKAFSVKLHWLVNLSGKGTPTIFSAVH